MPVNLRGLMLLMINSALAHLQKNKIKITRVDSCINSQTCLPPSLSQWEHSLGPIFGF